MWKGWAGVFAVTLGVLGMAATGVLHIYTALDVDEAKIYIEAFQQRYPGIRVEWVRLSAGELLARLRAEAANPQASLWLGGPSDTFMVAKAEGLLAPYRESLGWQYLPAKFKDPEGYWVGIYMGFLAFASNKDYLERYGLNPRILGTIFCVRSSVARSPWPSPTPRGRGTPAWPPSSSSWGKKKRSSSSGSCRNASITTPGPDRPR